MYYYILCILYIYINTHDCNRIPNLLSIATIHYRVYSPPLKIIILYDDFPQQAVAWSLNVNDNAQHKTILYKEF